MESGEKWRLERTKKLTEGRIHPLKPKAAPARMLIKARRQGAKERGEVKRKRSEKEMVS